MGGWLNALGKGALGLVNTGYQSQEYAEKMAKNYMQWHVADLRRAGLNPVLGYSAGAPQPGTVSGINLTGLISNYLGSKATAAQVALQGAQQEKVVADTRIANAEATITEADALNAVENAASKKEELYHKAGAAGAEWAAKEATALKDRYQADVNSAHAMKERLGIPQAEAEAEMWKRGGQTAKWGAYLSSILRDVK